MDLPIIDSPASFCIVSECPSTPESYRKDNIRCFQLGLPLSLIAIAFFCRSSLFIIFLDIVGVHWWPALICALSSLSDFFVCRFHCLACRSLLRRCRFVLYASCFSLLCLVILLNNAITGCFLLSRHAVGLLSTYPCREKKCVVLCFSLNQVRRCVPIVSLIMPLMPCSQCSVWQLVC